MIYAIATSLLLTGIFSVLAASHVGLNADAIYPYSLAKDIVEGIPLASWHMPPAPYYFPDLLLSLPAAMLNAHPIVWFYAAAMLQPLLFIAVAAWAFARHYARPYTDMLQNITVLSVVGYEVFRLLDRRLWDAMAGNGFVLGHHMFAAIAAMAFYLALRWLCPRSRRAMALCACAALAIGISDPFFLLFFAVLMIAHLLVEKVGLPFYPATLVTICAALGLAINHVSNHALSVQAANTPISFNMLENLAHFYRVVRLRGVLFLIAMPLIGIRTQPTRIFALATLLLTLLVAASGMVTDIFQLRYLCLCAPLYVYMFATAAFCRPEAYTLLDRYAARLMGVLLVASLLLLAFYGRLNPLSASNQHILACPELPALFDKPFAAEYWEAKVVFEMEDRALSVTQVAPDMKAYPWIFNSGWPQRFAPKGKGRFVLLTPGISSKTLNALAPAVRASHCAGLALEVECHRARTAMPANATIASLCL